MYSHKNIKAFSLNKGGLLYYLIHQCQILHGKLNPQLLAQIYNKPYKNKFHIIEVDHVYVIFKCKRKIKKYAFVIYLLAVTGFYSCQSISLISSLIDCPVSNLLIGKWILFKRILVFVVVISVFCFHRIKTNISKPLK